jgi:predicted nucleic acid-binding protein
MRVLIDTSVWLVALRRPPRRLDAAQSSRRAEVARLVTDDLVAIIGPIRQELLSGVRDAEAFERLRTHLRPFPDEPLLTEDFESAARLSNRCRAAGVAGSLVDFLICAVATAREWSIYTTDRDFERYGRVVPLRLHDPPVGSLAAGR